MTARDIIFHESARERFDGGLSGLADAVKAMLGPKRQNVVLKHSYGVPAVPDKNVAATRDLPPAAEAVAPTGSALRTVAENVEAEVSAPPVVNANCEVFKANAGNERSTVASKVLARNGNFGWNAATGEFGDLLKMGLADPANRAPAPLQDAASAAAPTRAADTIVAELSKEEKPARPAPELDS